MRVLVFAFAAALAACATGASESEVETGPSPFPVARGAAPAPPAAALSQGAPLEGRAPGGVDFGPWRSADSATYAPAFQSQMRTRYAGRSAAQIRADLEANGFACEDGQTGEGGRLDCRIEIMERQCAFDWYVVLERTRPEPVAGFDLMCLGAQ